MTKPQRYGVSSMPCDQGLYILHKDYLALEAECEALRAVLATQVFTAGYSPHLNALAGLEGAHWGIAHDVFYNSDKPLTVFYGEKRIYANLAAFCEAHPKEKA
jgi:hypothetical protein